MKCIINSLKCVNECVEKSGVIRQEDIIDLPKNEKKLVLFRILQ